MMRQLGLECPSRRNMKYRGGTILLSIVCLTLAGCVTPINHNEDLAAIKAVEFARIAFIQRDIESASKLLPSNQQHPDTVETLSRLVSEIHPSSYPRKVTATSYERIPGQKAMKIYLLGENDSEKFYYCLVMVGTSDEGYAVSQVFRSQRPYASTGRQQPLQIQRSAGA
jgi:hypothetical protein